MANRDRREVRSRLRVLLGHILKWLYQPEMRTNSWRGTIAGQRQALEAELRASRTLRNHAEAVLPECYVKAVTSATRETGLPAETFPAECPWTLEQLLSAEVLGE